ncbi:MAG: glycosyltransferase [Clostridiales bacterium]|nr:glycosyltransferase [Clostridiales bacterium]
MSSKEEKRLKTIKKQILKSRLFDEDYYRAQFQTQPEGDIIEYYFLNGINENKNPGPDFDNNFYLEKYPDVKEAGINPLYHYILFGKAEGRLPVNPADNTENDTLYDMWVKNRLRDFRQKLTDIKDIVTIIRSGMFEGQFYLDNNKDVERKLKAKFGWKLRLSGNPLLRSVGRVLTTPVIHYVFKGMYEDRRPCYEFSPSYYMNTNPDLLDNMRINPFIHYIKHGKAEGRSGNFYYLSDLNLNDIYAQNSKRFDYKTNLTLSIVCTEDRLEAAEAAAYDYKEIIPIKDSIDEAVKKAKGDIICIFKGSETPDYGFLKKAVKFFKDESVYAVLNTKENLGSYDYSILSYIDFAMKNLPEGAICLGNVVFRNTKSIISENSSLSLDNGDDVYPVVLNLIAGGKAVLIHSENASDSRDFKDEPGYYKKVLNIIAEKYALDNSRKLYCIEKVREAFGRKHKNGFELFEEDVDYRGLMGERKPNLLIGIYAFSFGGGEIMPIRLANKFYDMGYNVTVFCLKEDKEENDPKVREILNRAIPVIYADTHLELALNIKRLGIQVISSHHQGVQSFVCSTIAEYPELEKTVLNVGTSHGMYENLEDEILEYLFSLTALMSNTDYWTYVADKNLKPFMDYNVYRSGKFIKIPNGMERPEIKEVDLSEYGIGENSFTAAIASRAMPQKGWLHAINAVKAVREKTGIDVHLLLLGEGEFYTENAKKLGNDFIHFLGFRNNPCDYFAKSDLCMLPSYYASESAPLCIIEALMCGIPVLASNIGDVKYMLDCNGELAGDIFDLEDMTVNEDVLAEKLLRFVTDKAFYDETRKRAVIKAADFEIGNICRQYIDVYNKVYEKNPDRTNVEEAVSALKKSGELLVNAEKGENCPKVSVVVPNYNHSLYIRKRLDCIYNQSYKNTEVLLLDDCSTDGSPEIMREYAEKYPEKSRVMFNEKNSGGVFYQWAKGIKSAEGDLVWIAESDDFCETNMLEKLIPAFEDEKVKLSYCQYAFTNEKGEEIQNGFFKYVGELDEQRWRGSFVADSGNEADEFLGIKNTIPNASGAVFRKPDDFKLFDYDDWYKMKICGDWIFYLCILYGGKLAYTADTKSYFRFHSSNSSAKTYMNDTYYVEHEMVAKTLRKLYHVPRSVIERNNEIIFRFYREHVGGTRESFEKLYSAERILSDRAENDSLIGKQTERYYKDKYKTVLINPIIAVSSDKDKSLDEKMLLVGGNTGNMVFVDAMRKQLVYKDELWFNSVKINIAARELPVSGAIASSNFIIANDDSFIRDMAGTYEGTDCPITMVGLGSQAYYPNNTPRKLVSALSEEKINFFRMAADRCVSLGVRGEFTADCLEIMGIKNYRIIGCPTIYNYFGTEYKKLPKPTAEKLVFNVTAKRTEESKLLEFGIKNNGEWIMQMMTELPELLADEGEVDEKTYYMRYPGISLEQSRLKKFMKKKAHMFFDLEEWTDFLKNGGFTFSFGSRFHGNMMALRNGIPALWITHDNRTAELIDLFKLPHLTLEEFTEATSIDELIDKTDYNEFYKAYPTLVKEYAAFLRENNLENKFKV